MKQKHTPGPWTIQTLTENQHGYAWPVLAIRSPANVCLAVVGEIDRYESEKIPANARIMAAAPEMYALVRAWLITDPYGPHAGLCQKVVDQIQKPSKE